MRLLGLYMFIILLCVSTAQAREEFWYLGAGGGSTFLQDKEDAFEEIEEKSFTAKTYLGYRASHYLALELEYAYLGEYDLIRASVEDKAEFSALSFSIVVMYPLVFEDFELYTPVGISAIAADYGIDDDVIGGFKLGFGIAYTPTKHFTMRMGGEVTVFDLEVEETKFKQNLASVYATVQVNF